jgi:arylsulfatase A-like enzyme
METKKPSLRWNSLFLLTCLAVYLYVFNEWLFAITKPSFVNGLGFPRQLEILLTLSALLAVLSLPGLLPLVILSLIPPLKKYTDIWFRLGGLLPAVIFATLILMMIDNFTYTVFKFGIVSTEGWARRLYGLGFILVILLCYQRILSILPGLGRRIEVWGVAPKWIFSLLAGVLLLSVAVLAFPNQIRAASLSYTDTAGNGLRPHILLITSDGLSADHMSLYGYERETTPHIQELAASSLVAENAFANSAKTSGSVMSIYTGKYPAETRMFFPPNVLNGKDAYEHLPGILRSQGYKTIEITAPYYVDAREFNLLEGFDEVKTSGLLHSKYLNQLSRVLPHDKALFIDESFNRVIDRIRHIFFIETMTNPYLLVTGQINSMEDIERMEFLKEEIRVARQPVFVHVHLMVTHGPKYKPSEQIYSTGQAINAQALWTKDLYDDSILDFDRNIGGLIDYLTALDALDITVIILGSDHGQKWDPLKRLPLLIRFPHGEFAGKIRANVHNLDIAPTILDYLGLDQPGWMHGKSLIAGEPEQRPIFSMSAIDPEDLYSDSEGGFSEAEMTSISNDLYVSTVIYCRKWFRLDLYFKIWDSGTVEGSTADCSPGNELTDEQAFQLIAGHLNENGYNFSTPEQLRP